MPPVAVTLIAVVEQVNTVEPVLLVIPAVGAVVLDVTVMLEVAVHPLEPVAVTVYVPFVVMLCVALEPRLLFHEYESPPVAVTLIAVVEQVSTVEPVVLVIPAAGAVVFDVTVMLEVAVHPLAPVAVTVYVPAAVILKASDVPTTLVPLDHEYEEPPVAVTLIDVLEQVNSVEPVVLVIPAVGAVLGAATPDPASLVQPYTVCVTV